MSGGYAARLKDYPNKGVCGLPELTETKRAFLLKTKRLACWIKEAQRIVVLTGAGISTSSGIPDFRGPSGIWTREKARGRHKKKNWERESESASISSAGRKRPREPAVSMDFSLAKPTLTHKAITRLATLGLIRFCITQNVDGLHRRSGLPRAKHAVLHGCVFTEKCEDCNSEFFRDTDVGGMSFQKTGRKCEKCNGDLRDTLLDWEDQLPESDLERSTAECKEADLVLCLGTSLRIEPAGSLPTLAKKFVIVNLQETPYDNKAALLIRARVDDVMQSLMEHLGYPNWQKDFESPPVERFSALQGERNGIREV